MKGFEIKMKQLQQGSHFATDGKMGPRQNGFVLIIVITVIAIIGVEMFVLTDGANTMLFQSDTAYLEALERNLTVSGLAWAKQNIQNKSREILPKSIKLDVTHMNIRGSSLSVSIGTPGDKEAEVEINTSCSRGKRTTRYNGKYKIEL